MIDGKVDDKTGAERDSAGFVTWRNSQQTTSGNHLSFRH